MRFRPGLTSPSYHRRRGRLRIPDLSTDTKLSGRGADSSLDPQRFAPGGALVLDRVVCHAAATLVVRATCRGSVPGSVNHRAVVQGAGDTLWQIAAHDPARLADRRRPASNVRRGPIFTGARSKRQELKRAHKSQSAGWAAKWGPQPADIFLAICRKHLNWKFLHK